MPDPHRIGKEADRRAGEERGGRLLGAEFIFSSTQQLSSSCPKPADPALQNKTPLHPQTRCLRPGNLPNQARQFTKPEPHSELHPEEYEQHWSLYPRRLPVRLGAPESYSAG